MPSDTPENRTRSPVSASASEDSIEQVDEPFVWNRELVRAGHDIVTRSVPGSGWLGAAVWLGGCAVGVLYGAITKSVAVVPFCFIFACTLMVNLALRARPKR